MDEGQDEMLTTAETIAALEITRGTLYAMMRAGDIVPAPDTSARTLPRLRFSRAEVERARRARQQKRRTPKPEQGAS